MIDTSGTRADSSPAGAIELTQRDLDILAFESQWTTHTAAKEESIRDVFSLTAARYYQLLNAVIDSPAAVRHDPMLVGRLRRVRDAKARARAERAFTSSAQAGFTAAPHE